MRISNSTSLMLTTILSIVLACHKNNNRPSNSTTSTNNTNNTSSGPTPTPLSHTDSSLVGNWKINKHETYVSNTLISSTLLNDTVNCHLNLQATEVIVGANPDWRNGSQGLNNCVSLSTHWRSSPGTLDLSTALYSINVLTTNSLVIQIGAVSAQADIYYLHK
jgi:hypothetical protein